jgi:hypothetical protein
MLRLRSNSGSEKPKLRIAPTKDNFQGLKIVYRDARELKPDPRNTRTHSPEQIAMVKDSLLEFGWTNPAILHKKDLIVAGHGRQMAFLALKKDGEDVLFTQGYKIPCIYRDDMTEAQRRAYVIADNRLAELAGWDMDLLKDELNLLLADKTKVKIEATGFNMDFLGFENPSAEPSKSNYTDAVIDLHPNVEFEWEGAYDFPVVRKDKILDLSKVKLLATWAGRGSETRGARHWFYNFNSDSQVDLDWKKTILGFYVDDHRFECWYNEPDKYSKWAVNAGILGAIGPNFSTYFLDSKTVRLFAIYRSRWVTRYMQEAGINVIPDFSAGPEDVSEAMAGLRGIKTIAIQAHQAYDTEDKRKKKTEVINAMMKHLKPDNLLLYAPADRLRMFPKLKDAKNIILVEPRARVRQRREKKKLKGEE